MYVRELEQLHQDRRLVGPVVPERELHEDVKPEPPEKQVELPLLLQPGVAGPFDRPLLLPQRRLPRPASAVPQQRVLERRRRERRHSHVWPPEGKTGRRRPPPGEVERPEKQEVKEQHRELP